MTTNPTPAKAVDPLEQCNATNQALIAALRYMLGECGHLETDADYNFSNERAVLAAAEASQ
jgi:hypothetical protein